VEVEVGVDGRAVSLTFTARPSAKHLMRLLFASQCPDARERVHVHVHDQVHVQVHVQVDAVRTFTA
jgi:hypothetical protein